MTAALTCAAIYSATAYKNAHFVLRLAALISLPVLLGACGNGGGGDGGGSSMSATAGLSDGQRAQAADATAQSTTNACSAAAGVRPFYWEIGDANSVKASGSVGDTTYVASTDMAVASATKWLYSSYVAEVRAGVFTTTDIKFLNFHSGYTNFGLCFPGDTVGSCVARGTNGDFTAINDGRFVYDGGHMQKHASLSGVGDMNLGAMDNAALAAELRLRLGSDVALTFSQPQLAGGAVTSAADYAVVLRKMLKGNLRMGNLLGAHPVCTSANPLLCPQPTRTPVPATESWHYSVGHWVEDDPVLGDGAFSSPGAFGFYPWIDASKKYYGVLARKGAVGSGFVSVDCGRLIRKAWLSGVAQ